MHTSLGNQKYDIFAYRILQMQGCLSKV